MQARAETQGRSTLAPRSEEVASDGVVSSLTSTGLKEKRESSGFPPIFNTRSPVRSTLAEEGPFHGAGTPFEDFRESPYPYPQQVSKVNSL